MDRRSGSRPGWPRPRGLLGMLALVAAVELFLGLRDDFVNPLGLQWRFSALAARRRAAGCAILGLGDSLMKLGLVPEVVEARTGLPTCNLALAAGPPPASYFQLRRALEAGARPRAVLVDFIPHLLDWDPQFCAQLLPEAASLRDCLDLARATGDADFFAYLALARLVPSVRDRYVIRARAAEAVRRLAGASAGRRSLDTGAWWLDSGGRKNPRLRDDRDLLANSLYPPSWRCAPVNAAYLRRLLSLAESQGVVVFWLMPPYRAEVRARRERDGLEAPYTRFARAVAARSPNLIVVDGRGVDYEASLHRDPIHLGERGARLFSAEVAEVVARHLGRPTGPRWVELTADGTRRRCDVADLRNGP